MIQRREFITLLRRRGGVAADSARAAASDAGDWIFERSFVRCGRTIANAVSRGAGGSGLCSRPAMLRSNIVSLRGSDERLPMLASDLVRRSVTLLVATAPNTSALAAKAATATIPIAFGVGLDPVQTGLVANSNRPGGNATGVSAFTSELGPKRLGLLRELMPKPGLIAFVIDPNNPSTPTQVEMLQAGARSRWPAAASDTRGHGSASR